MNIEKLNVEITRKCTLDCEHCFRGDSQKINISNETLINIFTNIKEIEQLVITGGEPLIAVNELEKIIELIKNNNVKIDKIILITNGTVLSSRVLKILKELSKISYLRLGISFDIFHQLELERKGLKDKRDNNVKFLKENLGAEEYFSENEKTEYPFALQPLGRVKKLNKERLKEINSIALKKYQIMPIVTWFQPTCYFENNRLYGDISIDVNGNIVKYGLSFEDEDKYSINLDTNINIHGFRSAINNFIDKEKQDDLIFSKTK